MRFYKKAILVSLFVLLGSCALFAQEFDRGIRVNTFVPKGQWLGGGAFSYSETTADNYKFLIIDDIRGTNYSFSVSPYLAYFFSDNMCAGVRFGYKRSMIKLDNTSISLSEDLTFDISDYYNLQHVYTGAAIFRNYLSLGQSKRFGLFNEVRLSFGGGQGKIISGTGPDLTGTYQDIFEMELGIIPGILAFITNDVAVEASVNIMGFKYKKYKQTTNQVYEGSLDHSSVNFKIDIFSINIGVSFYIPHLNPVRPFFKKKDKATGSKTKSGRKKNE